MKPIRSLKTLAVMTPVGILFAFLVLASRGGAPPDEQKKKEEPQPKPAITSEPQKADAKAEALKREFPAVEGLIEHKFDRDQFKKSATSIARADLLACRNLEAQITDGAEANMEEFGRMLTGTYLASRSVHGVGVQMDTVWLIQIKGDRGSSILIDRNNLGTEHFSNALKKVNVAEKKVAKPVSVGMVNCSFQFLDQYHKVSDQVHLKALGEATGVELAETMTLEQAWKKIVDSGYFNRLVDGRAARLGDGTREAVLPDGRRTSEKRIEEGFDPGAEYHLPMLVGGYFDISLRYSDPLSNKFANGRPHRGIFMKFDAEYRAAGIAVEPNAPTFGVEQGEFVKQGQNSAYVSFGANCWSASSCASKNGLAGPPEMVFQRVVVGAP